MNLKLLATDIQSYTLPHLDGSQNTVQTILSIVFVIIGSLALLIVTVSGFRYIISAGDPQQAATAKKGIIYALVGLVVAITADSIIAFVINKL